MDFDACISAVIAEHLEENFIGYKLMQRVYSMGLQTCFKSTFLVFCKRYPI